MDKERLEHIRQLAQDSVAWAEWGADLEWSLEELALDHKITKAECEEAKALLDWTIVAVHKED
jgi:hypothetical protein